MNKKVFYIGLIIISILLVTGCNYNEKKSDNKNETKTQITNGIDEEDKIVKVKIDDNYYAIDLEENETVKEFINILPKEFNMTELNGNEKYIYLDHVLPTNEYNPGYINKGDVMLYGNNCLVIFYKSFNSNYSYTKIGHINDLPDLDNNNIIVKFENN